MSGFNLDGFRSAVVATRIGRVPVPALAGFFPPGKPAAFDVRQLTADELAIIDEAVETNRAQAEVIRGLAGGSKEKAEAVLRELGLSADLRNTTVRWIEIVLLGTTEPKLERADVVRLANYFPIEFKSIHNEIARLTGVGAVLGESNGSGETNGSDSA